MFIDKIISFSKEDKEGEFCVSDGRFSLICYSYPITEVYIKQKVKSIVAYGCSEVILSSEENCLVEKADDYFAYHLVAMLTSRIEQLVQVGELKIQIDSYIPGDIHEGDYVSFYVQRLDCLFC